MRAKDFLSVDQLTPEELASLLARALELKRSPFSAGDALADRAIALVFEKPSLRTRVSFEMAAQQLGGHCLYLSPAEVGIGQRESVADIGRVLLHPYLRDMQNYSSPMFPGRGARANGA